MNIDTAQFLSLIADPNNLVIVFCIAVGYLVRILPFVPFRYAQAIVLAAGVIAGPVFIHPIPIGIVRGIIYAALSMMLYDLVISRVEDYLVNKFSTPPTKTVTSFPIDLQNK